MTFLAPFSAIAAAAIGIPILAAFYLLKLRRRPVRVSSTMLWEHAARDLQVNVPFRWIRPSVLLALHALILALIILAIGRPVLDLPDTPRARVVVIVDTSASMNARDAAGGPTRLERARERALLVARDLSRGATPVFSLISSGDQAALAGPTTGSIDVLRAQLAGLRPTDQPGDADAALRLAASIVGAGSGPSSDTETDSDDESGEDATARALVVVISDGGGLAPRPLALQGADVRFERVGPEPGAAARNLGITAIDAFRDRDDPALVRAFVEVASSAPEPTSTTVRLLADDVELDRVPIEVPGFAPDTPEQVGRTARTLAVRVPGAAVITAELAIEDALAADNRAGVAVPPARRPAVLLVAPAGADGQTPAPDPFLEDVLAEMPLRAVRVVPPMTYEGAGRGVGGFDVIIFDRVRPSALPVRPSVSFGAGIPGLETAEPEGAPGATRASTWRRSHPVMRDVNLDPLVVARPLGLPERAVDGSALAGVTVLARTDAGPLIVEATHAGRSHVVVGFSIASSNWPTHFGFPVFVAGAIETLARNTSAAPGVSVTTTDPVALPAPEGATLRGPVDRDAIGRTPDGLASFGVLERAGVYRVEGGTGAVPVNLVSESETRLASPEVVTVGGRQLDAGTGAGGPVELRHWLILAVLVLLAVEWAVYTILARA